MSSSHRKTLPPRAVVEEEGELENNEGTANASNAQNALDERRNGNRMSVPPLLPSMTATYFHSHLGVPQSAQPQHGAAAAAAGGSAGGPDGSGGAAPHAAAAAAAAAPVSREALEARIIEQSRQIRQKDRIIESSNAEMEQVR